MAASMIHMLKRFVGRTKSSGQGNQGSVPAQPNTFDTTAVESASLEDDGDISLEPNRHATGPGFQFMSDLHLEKHLRADEYAPFEIPRHAPYLILAGDIGRFCDQSALSTFLRRQCQVFDKVMLVPGNHEFYGTSRSDGLRIANELATAMPEKFVLMEKGVLDLGDTVVLGCTLHSHIPDDYDALTNDFQRIQGWRVADHNAEHAEDVAWLKAKLSDTHVTHPDKRVIIITHYAPTFDGTAHPRFEGSKLRHCFASSTLEAFHEWKGASQVSQWVFGHTHYNASFYSGAIKVVSNQPSDRDCHRKFDLAATI